jgi:menaquinone-dependent protoporphyrinogen oxidase
MRTLIAYDTAQGTTQEIASRIRDRLTSHDVGDVELASMTARPVPELETFDAVVLGSPIHQQGWLKGGFTFIKTHAAQLAGDKKPAKVWAFSVGLPPSESARQAEERMMEKKLRKYVPTMQGHVLFIGQWKKEGLPWLVGIILRCLRVKFEDKRDWNAIEKWADGIAEELKKGQGTEPRE